MTNSSAPPASDDALCAGHARIFDGETIKDIKLALQLCGVCKVLPECRDWAHRANEAPFGNLHGVAGGQLWGETERKYNRARQR
jgi:hypothetical protein